MNRRTRIDIFLGAIFFAVCILIFFYIFKDRHEYLGNIFWTEKQNEIGVRDQIVIDFSKNILVAGFEPEVEISPKAEFYHYWSDYGRKLTIVPRGTWEMNQIYFVKIHDIRNMFFVSDDLTMSFSTIKHPEVESFSPKKGAKNISIDIEEPLEVVFDGPLNDFNVKFEVSPKREIGYKISDDKKKINFVFKDGYEKGQEYKINLYIKHKKESKENYKNIYETYFETESLPANEWSKNFSERLNQAKRFTDAKIEKGKYIDINLGVQVMTIFENGEVLDSFLISSGKRGMDTPKGNFQVSNKHPRPWSKAYGLYMPYWMAIVPSGKFGIHELPEWPGGYKEGQNHLGIPVSHGCVRLGIGAAERVYNWADVGTPIVIY